MKLRFAFRRNRGKDYNLTPRTFVERYGKKFKNNRGGWLMCCPYPEHPDRTPSFSVSAEGLFFCWGCHRKGNFSRLLHDIAGWSWKRAIEHADLISKYEPKDEMQWWPSDEEVTISNGLLGLFDVDWEQGYERYLVAVAQNESIFPPWVLPFRKGFLPTTLQHFEAGYDKDYQRVTIPVRNVWSKLAGFLGRTCTNHALKYLVYPPLAPSRHVYGLNRTEGFLKPILVEGAWDVWMLHQNGFENACALMTSKISEAQIRLLVEQGQHYIIMFDHDKAGRAGAKSVASALLASGCKIDIAMSYPPNVADLKSLTTADIQQAIKTACPWPAPSALVMLE